MSKSAEKLKSELSRLSPKDRAELAHFLIHSLDDKIDTDAEAAWDAELTRRAAEIKDGTAAGEPADEVLRHLHDKHS